VATLGLSTAQSAALRYHGQLTLRPHYLVATPTCPFLVADRAFQSKLRGQPQWTAVGGVRRPTDKSDDMLIYRRSPARVAKVVASE
jgi:hypothetical protein